MQWCVWECEKGLKKKGRKWREREKEKVLKTEKEDNERREPGEES